MNASPPPNLCPTCGLPLPELAPGGLCPACLLKRTMQDPAPDSRPPEAVLKELAVAFPQLEVEELIGQGGMGRVFRARQPHLNRTVALKLLSAERADDPEWQERFTREARALARLSHPNIVQVYDFGDKPVPFLLMEHVDGVNLRQAMDTGGLTTGEALALIPKLCDALQYAHEHGVLHRDIKPENILIDTEGRVKLVDFGLAKLRDEGALPFTLTQSSARLGTLAYMAPEQVEKPAEVDHRADIYSLGVVFYEMLTGELPLGRFPTPSEASGIDPRLDGIVMRTLEKKQSKRPDSAQELRTEIARARAGVHSSTTGSRAGIGKLVALGLTALIAVSYATWMALLHPSAPGPSTKNQASTPPDKSSENPSLHAEWLRKQKADKPIYDRSNAWIAQLSRARSKEAQQEVFADISNALATGQPTDLRAAFHTISRAGEFDCDRAAYRDQARRYLASDDPEIRTSATRALMVCQPDESDSQRLLALVPGCTEVEMQNLAMALKLVSNNDFSTTYAVPMLDLLRRGMAAAQRDRGISTGFDARSVLRAIWGSKVSAEIEGQLIEWSHLGENENGLIKVANGSLGYTTFYYALSVQQNKSRAAIRRLLEIATHPDTTNVAGRCLWGLNSTVPDPADQAYVVSEVVKLLGLRHDSYFWRRGLILLEAYATPDHLPGIEALASSETPTEANREALQQIIETLRKTKP